MVEKKITADDVVRRIQRALVQERPPTILLGISGSTTTAPGRGAGFKNPMTTAGDLIRGGTSGAEQAQLVICSPTAMPPARS